MHYANAACTVSCAPGTSLVIASRTAVSQVESAINDRKAATAASNKTAGKDPSFGLSPSTLPAAIPLNRPMDTIGMCGAKSSAVIL